MRAVLDAPVTHRLIDTIREDGPLPIGRVRAIAVQLLDALEALHESGAVHGNVHPGTVELHADGRATFPVTTAGRSSVATPAGDLISLGATLFAATGGRPGPMRPVIEALLTASPGDSWPIARLRAAFTGPAA
ncbi:hypothetical protein [Paractinoplanes maris]|uniref:hypothetical protein n=1 Tax=Paractinoplanes maris TaxID=1734446 RepID=UPI00202037E4|nr:hypothetical protein [Actinoplanes maris]